MSGSVVRYARSTGRTVHHQWKKPFNGFILLLLLHLSSHRSALLHCRTTNSAKNIPLNWMCDCVRIFQNLLVLGCVCVSDQNLCMLEWRITHPLWKAQHVRQRRGTICVLSDIHYEGIMGALFYVLVSCSIPVANLKMWVWSKFVMNHNDHCFDCRQLKICILNCFIQNQQNWFV